MRKILIFLALSTLLPWVVFAQFLPDQNQITQSPFGGIVYSTSTSDNAQLGQLIGNTYGQLMYWDGTQWNLIATSSLGISSTPAGNNGDLQYNASGIFGGISTSTLTPVSPLTGSFIQIGSSGALGCQTASGSQAGCLSSADWTTFNSKSGFAYPWTFNLLNTFSTSTNSTTTSYWTQGSYFSSSTQASQFPYASTTAINATNIFGTTLFGPNLTTKVTIPYASSTAFTVSGSSYLGTVRSGVWNGTTIAIANGGTNATSMTTSGNGVYYTGSALATAPTNSKITIPYSSSTAFTATNIKFTNLMGPLPIVINFNDVNFINYDSSFNVGFGPTDLGNVSGAARNSAFGGFSLGGGNGAAVTGSDNSGFGYNSLEFAEASNKNTALGSGGLSSLGVDGGLGSFNDGDSNTAVGYNAFHNLGTSNGPTYNNNIAIGSQAGENLVSGSSNIVIGTNIDVPSDSGSNLMSIGNLIFGTGIDGTDKTISSGNVGIASINPSSKLTVSGTGLITGLLTANSFTATSTLVASVFPYASTTAITATTASTTNLILSSAGGSGTRCVQVSANGTLSASASACESSTGGSDFTFGTNNYSTTTAATTTSIWTQGVFFSSSTAATSTFANGITIVGGCFSFNGACLSNGTSVTLSAIRNYAATTSWSVPTNLAFAIVEVFGGGGEGGNCDNTGDGCGGGGGGGYTQKLFTAASLEGTTSIQAGIGTGGTGSADTASGNPGNTSNFGGFATSTGGTGGTRASAANAAGGTGGTGSGGDINTSGGAGFVGVTTPTAQQGNGGSVPNGGSGGKGGTNSGGSGTQGDGCGGGGGGASIPGVGGAGCIIIYEYTVNSNVTSGSVGSGTGGQLAYYPSSGTAVTGFSHASFNTTYNALTNPNSDGIIFYQPAARDFVQITADSGQNAATAYGVAGSGFTIETGLLSYCGGNSSAWSVFIDGKDCGLVISTSDLSAAFNGSSTPWGQLSVEMGTKNPSFVVSNQGSSSPSLIVSGINQNGTVGVGTSTPWGMLSVVSSTDPVFVVATSSGASIAGYDGDGHRFTSGPTPGISSCGTGTGTVVGDDQSGTITTATAATACTLTFSKAYKNTPTCRVTDNSTIGFADVSSISTTAVTFGISSALTGGLLYYDCTYHR